MICTISVAALPSLSSYISNRLSQIVRSPVGKIYQHAINSSVPAEVMSCAFKTLSPQSCMMMQSEHAIQIEKVLFIHVATMNLRQADHPESGFLIRRYVGK
jgi:hypothetical protein